MGSAHSIRDGFHYVFGHDEQIEYNEVYLTSLKKRVLYECTYTFHDDQAIGVIIICKKPMDLPGYQTDFKFEFSSPPSVLNEGVPGHELFLWYLKGTEGSCYMKYEYTYYQKSILEGVNSNVVEPLSIEERNEYIQQIHGTEPYRYDYNNPKFIQWYENGGLDKVISNENEYYYAERVLKHIANSLEINRNGKGNTVEEVITRGKTTCHGCNSMFIASMRRHGIPARCKHGCKLKRENVEQSTIFEGGWKGSRPLQKLNGHSKSEFWMEGNGWIPVESVIRDPDTARKHIAGNAEKEPHLVKYFDNADPTKITKSDLGNLFGSVIQSIRGIPQIIELGQLSNVHYIPIGTKKTKNQITSYQRYDIE